VRFSLDVSSFLAGAEEWGENAKYLKRAVRSALGSVGWMMTGLLWRETETHMPKLNPHSAVLTLAMMRAAAPRERNAGGWVYKYSGRGKKRRRVKHFHRIGSARRGTGGRSEPPFRKARNSLRYKVRDNLSVQIGFLKSGRLIWGLSRSIAEQAEAAQTPITEKMRKFFFAAGCPLSKGRTSIFRPARPWLDPTLERNRDKINTTFATKFYAAMERYKGGA